jgi:hypothetical protein
MKGLAKKKGVHISRYVRNAPWNHAFLSAKKIPACEDFSGVREAPWKA